MSLADLEVEMDNFDGVSSLEDYPEIDYDTLGIDPEAPTVAKPGSEEKVVMLSARYAAGLPLWHNEDCVDHGPDDEAGEE